MRRTLLLLVPLFLIACSKAPPAPLPGSEKEYPPATIPGFSIDAKVIQVLTEDVLLFDYATEEETTAELAKLSDDGRKIDGKDIPWREGSEIHVFATGRQIAIYIGSTKEVLEALMSEGGAQVVGDPLPAGVKMPASSAAAESSSSM